MQSKKGQIAIWVILALVLVGSILLFFFLEQKPIGISGTNFSPEQYLDQCVGPAIDESINIMMPQGGFISPENFKLYNDTKVSYLCRTDGSFIPCVNEHPVFMSELENEIRTYISQRVENCFVNMKTELEGIGDVVDLGSNNSSVDISMAPGLVIVNVGKNITLNDKGTTRSFDKFEIRTQSPIYNLASVAMNIVNNERNYCYFNYVGYMAFDKTVDIREVVMSDSTKIYNIKDIDSGKAFNIAIRGCVIPAGI